MDAGSTPTLCRDLLIHLVLFEFTPIHLFSMIQEAHIRIHELHLQAIPHQECTTIGNSYVQNRRGIDCLAMADAVSSRRLDTATIS
jgi:hypothetical protein